MKGDLIPSEDNLALQCPPIPGVAAGIEMSPTGAPAGITRDAFRVDDNGVSTNWIEFDGGNIHTACVLIASVRKVRRSHRIGRMNVGEAIQIGNANQKQIKALHDPIELPDPPNPGHALLAGMTPNDVEFLDQLALLVELEPFSDEAVTISRAKFGR